MKNTSKVTIRKLFFLIVVLFAIVTLINCEVGLGESVDTQPPTIDIAYPPTSSIIRDTFIMSGQANDETNLSSVTIQLENTANSAIKYGPFQATISGTTWQISINANNGDGTFQITDGEYKVVATATDSAGRTSTSQTTYKIDNTSPVLVVSTPTTKGIGTPYGFGSELNFEGLQFDENQDQVFKFEFYKMNADNSAMEKIAETRKQNALSNWTIDISSDDEAFQKLVAAMSDANNAETFWYVISVCDASGIFTNSSEGENNTEGNWSTHYYSWTDISDLVQPGESTPKINSLYRLDHNIQKSDDIFPTGLSYDKLKSLRLLPENINTKNVGSFSIDPEGIYPVVKIEGWTFGASASKNQIGPGATLRIEIGKGKNANTVIMRDAMSVTLKKNDEAIYTNKAITAFDGTSPVVVNWNLTEAIESGDYQIEIQAKNNKEKEARNNIYTFSVNLGSPTITVFPGSSATSTVHVTNDSSGKETFSVKITGDDDGKELTLNIYDYDSTKTDNKGEVIFTNTKTVPDGTASDGRNRFNWETSISSLTADSQQRELRELIFEVIDSGNYKTTLSRKYIFKRTVQKIKRLSSPWTWTWNSTSFNELTEPSWVSTGNILQIVGASGYESVDDNNENTKADLGSVLVYVDTENKTSEQLKTVPISEWNKGSVTGVSSVDINKNGQTVKQYWSSFKADISPVEEGKTYNVWIRLADNTTLESASENSSDSYGVAIKIGKVSIDTLYPVTSLEVLAEDIAGKDEGNIILCKGDYTIKGTSSDVFRKSVTLKRTFNGNTVDITSKLGTSIPNDKNGWSFEETSLPEGTYTYTLSVEDNVGHKSTQTIVVRIDKTAPTIVVNGFDSNKVNIVLSNAKIEGLISDVSTLKKYSEENNGYLLYSIDSGLTWKVIEGSDIGSWSFNVGAIEEDGTYKKIRFKAKDKLGNERFIPLDNEGKETDYKYGYDSANPTLNLLKIIDTKQGEQNYSSGTTNYTVTGDYYITGDAFDKNGVVWVGYNTDTSGNYIKIKSGTVEEPAIAANVSETWNNELTKIVVPADGTKDGTTPLWICAEDTYGKQTIVKLTMLYDTQAPIISGITLTNNSTITSSSTVINGSWFDNGGSGLSGGLAKLEYKLNGYDNDDGWTEFTFPLKLESLSEGRDQKIAFRTSDKVGNKSGNTAYVYTFHVDTQPPVITVTSSSPTYLKKGESFTFAGTASDTQKLDRVVIKVKKDGVDQSGFCKTLEKPSPEAEWGASPNNVWTTKTLTSVAETETETQGIWTFQATAYDSSGQYATTAIQTIKVDATAPTVIVTTYPKALTDTPKMFTFKGSASDGGETYASGVNLIKLSLTSDSEHTDAVTASGTSWQASPISLGTEESEGVRHLYVQTTDNAGNVSEWIDYNFGSDSFVYDSAPPVVTETGNLDSASAEFSLTGKVTDNYGRANDTGSNITDGIYITQKLNNGDPVVISSSGLTWTDLPEKIGKDGTWTLSNLPRDPDNSGTYKLQDGTFTYTITTHDKAGKTGNTITRTVEIDMNPPDKNEITIPSSDVTGSAFLSGTELTFKGSAKDKEGGKGVSEIWYVFNQNAIAPQQGTTSLEGYTQYIDSTVSDGLTWSIVRQTESGTDATASLTNKKICEGLFYLHVKAKDAAGNITPNAATRAFEVDLSNPTLTNVTGDSSLKNTKGLFDLSLTANDTYGIDSITITQKKDGVNYGTVLNETGISALSLQKSVTKTIVGLPKKADGTTNAALDGSDDGIYEFSITAKDKVGRTVVSPVTRVYRLDTTAPSIEVTKPAEGEASSVNTFTIRGTVIESGSGIKQMSYSLDEGESKAITPTGSSWVVEDVPLGDVEGTKVFKFNASDNLDNTMVEKTITMNYDLKDPELSVTSLDLGTNLRKSDFLLKGHIFDSNALNDDAAITITVEKSGVSGWNKTWTIKKSDLGAIDNTPESPTYKHNSWTQNVTTTDLTYNGSYLGTYTFTIIAKDIAGKTTSTQRTVILDNQVPNIVFDDSTPSDDKLICLDKHETYTASGTASDSGKGDTGISSVSYALSENDTAPTDEKQWKKATGTENWIKTLSESELGTDTYKDKTLNLFICATDGANNTNTTGSTPSIIKRRFITDSAAPSLEITTTSGKTTKNDFVLYGTVSGNDATSEQLTAILKKKTDDTGATLSKATLPEGASWAYTVPVSEIPANVTGGDGVFTVTLVAKDKNNRLTEKAYSFTRDTTAPTFNVDTSIPSNGQVILDSEPKITLVVSDNVGLKADGVTYEYYKLTTGNDPSIADNYTKQGETKTLSGITAGLTSKTAVINMKTDLSDVLKDGYWKLKVLATDQCEGTPNTVEEFTYYFIVDRTVPNLTVEQPADITSYSKIGDNIAISGKATDEGGLSKVDITVKKANVIVGSSSITSFGAEGLWTHTFNAGDLVPVFSQTGSATYEVTIVATDIAGRTKEANRSIFYDVKTPVITITSISPSVIGTGVNSGKTLVNGTITVKGTTSDDDKVAIAKYKWNGGSETSLEYEAGNNTVLGSTLTNWTLTFDTTTTTDLTVLSDKLQFIATDRAGNVAVVSGTGSIGELLAKYKIDQSSDKPNIEPTNSSKLDNVTDAGYDVSGNAKNVFSLNSNNLLTFSCEDDDGVNKIWIKFGDNSFPEAETYKVTGTPTTYQYRYTIPATTGYGRKSVYIRISDKNWDGDIVKTNSYTDYGPLYIAIDEGAPALNVNAISDYVPTTFTISGSASDIAGITSVKVNTAESSYNNLSNSWSHSYSVPAESNGETLTITATNTIGHTTSKLLTYQVDRGNPEISFDSGFGENSSKVVDSNSPSLRVTGTALDPTLVSGNTVLASGISQVRYQVKRAKWNGSSYIFDPDNNDSTEEPSTTNFTPSIGTAAITSVSDLSATWSANIDLSAYSSAENVYLLYVATFDNAGNVSVSKGLVIKMDTKVPVVSVSPTQPTTPTAATGVKGEYLFNKDFVLTGTASDTVELTSIKATIRNGSPLTVAPTTISSGTTGVTWTVTVPVENTSYFAADGTYEIVITATDGCAKTTTTTYSFVRDTKAPDISFSNIDSTGTFATPVTKFTSALPEILGTYADSTSGIKSIKYLFKQMNGSDSYETFQIWDSTLNTWKPTEGENLSISDGTTSGAIKLPMDKFLGNIVAGGADTHNTDGIWIVSVYAEDYAGNKTTVVSESTAFSSKPFRVDRHIPSLTINQPSSNKIVQKGDGITISGTSSDVCGGEIDNVYIKIVHDSDSQLKSEKTLYPNTDIVSGSWEWQILSVNSPFDADNDYTITVKVTDKGGNTKELERKVSCDNTPPEIRFKRPFTMSVGTNGTSTGTSQTNRIIGDLTVEGTITDFAMGSIYYQVGGTPTVTKNESGSITSIGITGAAITEGAAVPIEPTITGNWVKSSDNYGWSFQANTMQYKDWAEKVTENGDNDTNLKTLYIHIASIDQAGNINYAKFPIKIDTDGDKPISIISAPETDQSDENGNFAKVGGSFVVSGGATDDNYVHSVYMQVEVVGGNYVTDVNGIKTLTAARAGVGHDVGDPWTGSEATKGQTAADILAGSSEGATTAYFTKASTHSLAKDDAKNETDNEAWYKIDGTTAWKYTLNRNKEFFLSNIKDYLIDDPGAATPQVELKIYIKTLDTKVSGNISTEDGKKSRFGEVVELRIKIDSDVPGIELTDFPAANSYVTSSIPVEFRLTDDSGINSFELTANDSVIVDQGSSAAGWTVTKTATNDWTISGTITDFHKDALNKSKLKISVEDNSGKTSSIERAVIVDTQAPKANIPAGVEEGKSWKLKSDVSDATAGDRETADRGNHLRLKTANVTISGKVEDEINGSGIKNVVLYFTRTNGSVTTLFNLTTGAETDISANQLTMQQEMGGDTTIAFPVASINDLKTKKDNGVVSPYIVVDTAENGSDTSYNGDGDGYNENLKADGNWFVIYDTTNLPDGAYDINYVIIDNSGNARWYGDKALVQNNPPYLSSVIFATDINGDGVVNTEISPTNQEAKEYLNPQNTTITTFESRNSKLKVIAVVEGANSPLTVTLTYPTSSGTKELSIKTADKASNTQATYDSVTKKYTCTFDEITDFAADSTSATDYKSFKIKVTDRITPVLTSGEKTLQILYNNIDKVKPEASFYPINGDVKTAISSTTDYTTSLGAAISKAGGESLFRYYGKQNGYDTKNLVSGHVEPRNGMPSGTNNPALSGVVILRGKVSDNQRIAKVKLLLNGTEEASAVPILEWNTTEKKMVPTTGTNAIVLNEKLDQEGHSFEWAYAWDTTTVTATGVGENLPIRVIAEDFSTINTETVKGPLKSEKIDYTNSESTYNAENIDVVPYISSIKTSLFNRSTQNPTVYTRTALGKYPVRAGETIVLNGFNFGNSPVVTIDSTELTTSSLEKNATTSAFSVSVGIGMEAKTGELKLSNGTVSTNNNTNNNGLTVNQQPNNANNKLLTDDVELDIWEFKNIATPAVSAFKSPNVKISPNDGTIGASFSNFLFFNMAGKRNDENNVLTQTPYQLAYNGCEANTFAFDRNGWTYGAVQYQTNNSQGISGYFQFFTGKANTVSNMFLDGVYFNVYGATRLEANALNLREDQTREDQTKDKSKWMTNLYRITSPVIIPVATSESAVKVHIAYCDTTTHQIRYRNGIVDPTKTRDAIYVSGALQDVANLTGKQGNSRPECPSDSIRTTVGQRVHIVANSGASLPGAETVASVYSNITTYGAGEYVDMGILNNNSTVVLAWHDSESNRLIFTYNDNPDDGTQDGTYKSLAKGTGAEAWQTNAKVIDTDSGAFARLAVDSANGIHIAYYSDSTSSLKYAYLSSVTATPVISTIDSYLEVGKNITLNVAENSAGKQVPYIGYYANSLAKEAYRVNFADGNNAGVDEDEYFTRNWEVSFVPTSETVIDDTVNIGVWRDTSGALQAIPTGTSTNYSNGNAAGNVPGDSSRVYANGTMNPIVAYINKSGALEMAQKK